MAGDPAIRWQYDFLSGLAYFARIDAPRNPRLQDAIDLLLSYQHEDGTWPVQNLYSSKVFFNIETVGKPSRWNTLRALHVLNWWDGRGHKTASRPSPPTASAPVSKFEL